MSVSYAEAALAAFQVEEARNADPMAHFTIVHQGRRHEGQHTLILNVSRGVESYARTPNIGGKTWVGGGIAVTCARGSRQLAGIPMPLRGRTVGAILSQSWPQQIEAAQKAVLALIGTYPHRVFYNRQVPEAIQLILVKPEGWHSDDPKTWSRIWFHVNRIPGGRLNWIWADEPPDMEAWREARNRGIPGQPFLSWITATPIKRPEWEPLKRDFELAQGVVVGGRIEIRWGLRDNVFLSEEDIRRQYEKNEGDPEAEARLNGEYVDASGDCPFPAAALRRMADQCKPPELVERRIWTEFESVDGRQRVPLMLTFERFYPVEYDESYYLDIDPSLGINKPDHDPGGVHLYSRIRPRLIARYHGYQTPYALGWLGATICADYRPDDPAYFDVEMNNGYGDTCIRAAREFGHTRFMFEPHEDRLTGEIENRIGWTTTTTNRGSFIGGVQRILQDGSIIVRSSGVVDTLRAVREQPNRRRIEGSRDEDMILLGRAAVTLPILGVPIAKPAPGFLEQVERELGRPLFDPRHETLPEDSMFDMEDWGPSPL